MQVTSRDSTPHLLQSTGGTLGFSPVNNSQRVKRKASSLQGRQFKAPSSPGTKPFFSILQPAVACHVSEFGSEFPTFDAGSVSWGLSCCGCTRKSSEWHFEADAKSPVDAGTERGPKLHPVSVPRPQSTDPRSLGLGEQISF